MMVGRTMHSDEVYDVSSCCKSQLYRDVEAAQQEGCKRTHRNHLETLPDVSIPLMLSVYHQIILVRILVSKLFTIVHRPLGSST